MKTLKAIATIATGALMAASCLSDDDPYQAGFMFLKPSSGVGYLYANNVTDSVVLYGYGDWAISNYSGYDNSWVTLPLLSGKGEAFYGMRAEIQQNTTGKSRGALFRITDTAHPGDGAAAFGFWQFATRGDGSLGNAADVRAITGSDGSTIAVSYDVQHRPTFLMMIKGEETLCDMTLRYYDRDSMVYVTANGVELRSYCGNDYQPQRLYSTTDTIGYYTLYYNYTPIDYRRYFNFEHRRSASAGNTCVRYKFPQSPLVSLAADSLHLADSLSYFKGTELVRKLGLEYSNDDNRHQSLDVNQLVLGIGECDPYLLLSLFRYCRNTSIVSRARGEADDIRVETELNADHSVARMTVTKADGTSTVYTFTY